MLQDCYFIMLKVLIKYFKNFMPSFVLLNQNTTHQKTNLEGYLLPLNSMGGDV